MAGGDKTGYVYFMSNVSRMIYIGVTSDLNQRVGQHKAGFYPGFTKKYKMDRLVYVETFPDMLSAIARETQLKNWSRGKKVTLIRERNPEWLDLARSA
ncbi:MAG TPA: GIY-YIG nuclease family protein [Candidatus Methylacidiphilales bacterium]